MLRIGLTGNMGSGKTSVCRVFEILGIPIFYADTEAKKLFSQPFIQDKIRETFGEGVFNPDGLPNNKALAAIVFRNKEKLKQLNDIIHPAVFEAFEQWAGAHQHKQHKPYCIQEAAILFETGSYTRFDHTVLVYAPVEMLIDRVMRRDGISRQETFDRLSNQMDQEEKKSLADFIVLNDNSKLVIPQVLELHATFLKYKKG